MVGNNQIEPKTITISITGSSVDLLSIGLEIRFTNNNKLVSRIVSGKLPSLSQQLLDTYQEWKRSYLAWGQKHRYWQRAISTPKNPIETNVSFQDCDTQEKLIQEFNQWINVDESPGLAQIARNLLINVIPGEYKDRPELLSFVIQTKTNDPQLDLALQRLPWNEWRFIRKYYNAGIALSTNTVPIIDRQQHRLTALVICGKYNDPNHQIDLQPDLDAIQANLGDTVELEFWISDPATTSKLDLLKKLDIGTYHLLFFCGHSSANNHIQLNDSEYISANETRFQEILTKLKNRGLILAFFNSCDGLTIAHSLMSVGIPYIVVMKELVHDLVAQEFIKSFLEKAINPATPIHVAIDRARQQLQWLEGLPHGEFLPILFQNSEQPPFYLNPKLESIDILEPVATETTENNDISEPIDRKPVLRKNKRVLWLSLFGLGILIVASFGMISRYINITNNPVDALQGRISMGEQRLQGSDQGAEIDTAYQDFKLQKYQDSIKKFDAYLNSKNLYDNPEIVIYRNNARAYISHQDRGTKLIKLAVSVPFGNNRPIARELLRGAAQRQNEYNSDLANIHIIIEIGNDDNNPELTEKIATKFVADPDILAVIGHNASEATEAGANIYNPGKLVMLSPTSFKTTLRFPSRKSSIYRMVPQMTSFASKLARYTTNNLKHDTLKVGMCVHKDSPDNSLFHEQFNYILQGIGSKPIDLNCQSFSTISDPIRGQQIINTIVKEKINVLMLAPHIDTLPESLKFMKRIRQHPQLKNMTMIGSTSLYSGVISSQNQDNLLNGLILAVPYFPNPQNQFVTNFQKEWNQPLDTWRTAMSYAATSVITSNLDQTSTRTSLLNRMADHKIPYNSNNALPPFSFNTSGERKISDNPGELIQLDGVNFKSASNLDK